MCRVEVGDALAVGQRIGVMKFGSRMDVFLPPTIVLAVRQGDRVTAATTVLGRWEEA